MHLLHFHARGRYAPLIGLKIELAPFCGPKFGRTDKDQRPQLEGAYDGEIALIAINIAQKLGYLFRLGDGGSVGDRFWGVLRRVGLLPDSAWLGP